jgi:hypothetical protein
MMVRSTRDNNVYTMIRGKEEVGGKESIDGERCGNNKRA